MENRNKKERGRRKYFSDYPFTDVPKKGGNGTKRRRIYAGKKYSFVIPEAYSDAPNAFVSRIKGFYGAISASMLVLWIAAGMAINCAGHIEDIPYVILPYFVAVIPILLILFTVGELLITKSSSYERVFADSLSKGLRGKTIAAMIGAGMCALGEVIYICVKAFDGKIINGQVSVAVTAITKVSYVSLWVEIGYIFMIGAIAGLSYFYLKLQDSIKIEPI